MSAPLLSGVALRERAALALDVPLAAALGVRLVDDGVPEAGVEMDVADLAGNGAGGTHAAALSALMELAGYLAVAPALTADEHAITHSVTMSLVGAAREGQTVRATGDLDRRTRRLAFVSVVASTDDAGVVARAQLVKSVVPFG